MAALDLSEPLPSDLPSVDAVIHLAQANTTFPEGANELFRVNTASTQELLDYARRVGAEIFVYASSGTVYGFGEHPFRETDPVVPHDFYAVTKIGGEQLVSTYSRYFRTVVFRFFAPYGPGQKRRLIPGLIDRVRTGTPVTLRDGGRPRMNPIYVADVVGVLKAALDLEQSCVVNVAGRDIVGIRELAWLVAKAVGRDPVFEDHPADAPGDLVAATKRLHKLFDLGDSIGIEEGVRRTAAAVLTEPVF